MTAITLRNIPLRLQEIIQKRAAREGLSLNKMVLRMLNEAAGKLPGGRGLPDDLDALAGSWSQEEAAAFDKALAEQRRIDPELWR